MPSAPPTPTRILGIDPGSQRTGIGIIDVDAAGRARHVHHQPLVLLGADDFAQRLKVLVQGLHALIEEYQPQPNPLAQKKMELEVALLEAQVMNERAKSQQATSTAAAPTST